MVEMSMNKAIHGAVRRDLDRFAAALAAFPPGDLGRARQLLTAWANFDAQLTTHHEGEHTIAWPALAAVGVSADLLAELDAEHDAMAAALGQARAAVNALARSGSGSDAEAALAAVEHLKAVTVAHLDHEDAALEEVYLTKSDTPEVKAMGREFGKVGPSAGGQFFAWVLDGASDDERSAVTSMVPGPVVTIIGGVFGRSYRKNIAPVWRS
jgi:Hemerythrin HHE cation binding domain